MKNQLEFVVAELKKSNQISRNYCLANYISRLSAIIYKLEKIGWKFSTKRVNGDFVYFVEKTPITAKGTAGVFSAPQSAVLSLWGEDKSMAKPPKPRLQTGQRWFD